MYQFLTVLLRVIIVIPIIMTTYLVSFFAFNQTSLISSVLSIIGGMVIYTLISLILNTYYLKKHGLSYKEYRYIRKNMQEAKGKIRRLHKAIFSIRHLSILKQIFELSHLIRKIYGVTKKEPKRFYQGERFYFQHLDSAVALTEKYVLLASQPKKTIEVKQALFETRCTLKDLIHSIEKDLYHILSDDMEQLQFELDVAKHSIKTMKQL